MQGVVAIAADATDEVGVTSVQFQVDGADLGAAVTAPPYTVNWETTTVANGLVPTDCDRGGCCRQRRNFGSGQVTVANPVDTTPPTVEGVTPADGAVRCRCGHGHDGDIQRSHGSDHIDGTTVELRDSGNNLVAADGELRRSQAGRRR